MPMDPMPDLSALSLAEIARMAADQKLPPIDRWNPTHCGDSQMRIARDGTWYHQGTPIAREAMVRLFSTILRREEDGSYVLVTPVEKLDILVEDTPFVAVEMKAEGSGPAQTLTFRLNTGDLVIAGPEQPLRFNEGDDGPRPYLTVRGGMDALVARSVYYELANLAIEDGETPPGVWSKGVFFAMEQTVAARGHA
ncbi:DUF1285 domain-containing protein [Sphingomonas sp. GC_Shp_3]|uniref:DUF1285 domain-containing protein n=1 Tax=Sphingomonas sp. GC_Shp_3 TaxID=2937383 RepID=UPI002269FB6B|nr:DUF1285 domain-containing protein [Sphingomonas sp. GC_Shp_3]